MPRDKPDITYDPAKPDDRDDPVMYATLFNGRIYVFHKHSTWRSKEPEGKIQGQKFDMIINDDLHDGRPINWDAIKSYKPVEGPGITRACCHCPAPYWYRRLWRWILRLVRRRP